MARRRNKQSPGEALAGLVGIIFFFALLSPQFRSQLSSAVVICLSFLVLIGLAALVVYLFLKSKEDEPPTYPFKRSASPSVPRREPQVNPASMRPRPEPVKSPLPPKFPSESVLTSAPAAPQAPAFNPVTPPVVVSHLGSSDRYVPNTGNFDIGGPISPQPVKPVPPRQWDGTTLKIIEWRRFEKVTKAFLSMTGFVATETKTGADGGVDIRVHKVGNPEAVGIIQCKAWHTYKVNIKVVRELFGIMAADRIKMGMVITSGDFTSEAVEFGNSNKLKLVSGSQFFELIRRLPEEKQQHLLNVALEGDYSTPTCPQCDVKLVKRESSKGRSAGGHFWGCVNYPRCKQTLVYKE
jgi:ssDNA-binding Zn-finger/Zn-ribbon topoisomerase 1